MGFFDSALRPDSNPPCVAGNGAVDRESVGVLLVAVCILRPLGVAVIIGLAACWADE